MLAITIKYAFTASSERPERLSTNCLGTSHWLHYPLENRNSHQWHNHQTNIATHGEPHVPKASESARPEHYIAANSGHCPAPFTVPQKSETTVNYYSTGAQPESNRQPQYRLRRTWNPCLAYPSQYDNVLYSQERKASANSRIYANSRVLKIINCERKKKHSFLRTWNVDSKTG